MTKQWSNTVIGPRRQASYQNGGLNNKELLQKQTKDANTKLLKPEVCTCVARN